MAIVIDPGTGALAEAIASAGGDIARGVFRERIRERELSQNPAMLQSLVLAARAAQEKGPEALLRFEKALGVRQGFATSSILSFEPTLQQAQEKAALDLDLPGRLADLTLLQTLSQTQNIEQAMELGNPILEALGANEEIRSGIAKNRVERDYYTVFLEEGGPRIQVDTDLVGLQAAAARSGMTITDIQRYREGINSLDQSTPEGQSLAFMAASFDPNVNPGFANYLASLDEMNFRERLARFQANPTAKDKLDMTMSVLSEITKASDRIVELEEEGAPKDVLDLYRTFLGNWRNIAQELQVTGAMHEADLAGARPDRKFFGGQKGNEFVSLPTTPASIRAIYSAITSGNKTLEDFIPFADDPEFFPTEREKLAFTEMVSQARAVEAGQEVIPERPTGPTRAEIFLDKGGLLNRLNNSLARILSDPELDPVEKVTQAEQIREQIETIQEQSSLWEDLRSFGERTRERGGSFRVPGR